VQWPPLTATSLVTTSEVAPSDPSVITAVTSFFASGTMTLWDQISTALQKKSQTDLTTATTNASASNSADLKHDADLFPSGADIKSKKAIFALENADEAFDILVIPPYMKANSGDVVTDGDIEQSTITDAAIYCEQKRAMLLLDTPTDRATKDAVEAFINGSSLGTNSANAAFFFPRIVYPNPFRSDQPERFIAAGAMAGIFARTDSTRGVWKAPAGLDAVITGATGLDYNLTDLENGDLNPLGINCLRTMPGAGRVVWGSRTLQGDDRLASQWKYISVRRTALFIESSIFQGTQWVVFEPNAEPLWAQIRLNIGAFMHTLFLKHAFAGETPSTAYFVKCDSETTTQDHIDLGIVNIIVGFAPLKPAEFVIVSLQQMAGQVAA
jgi:phage tail sheath protein FI